MTTSCTAADRSGIRAAALLKGRTRVCLARFSRAISPPGICCYSGWAGYCSSKYSSIALVLNFIGEMLNAIGTREQIFAKVKRLGFPEELLADGNVKSQDNDKVIVTAVQVMCLAKCVPTRKHISHLCAAYTFDYRNVITVRFLPQRFGQSIFDVNIIRGIWDVNLVSSVRVHPSCLFGGYSNCFKMLRGKHIQRH